MDTQNPNTPLIPPGIGEARPQLPPVPRDGASRDDRNNPDAHADRGNRDAARATKTATTAITTNRTTTPAPRTSTAKRFPKTCQRLGWWPSWWSPGFSSRCC